MIQTLSKLKVADNSGAKEISNIKNLGNVGRSSAQIGNIIVASVKKATSDAVVAAKKGKVVRALIIRNVKGIRNDYGFKVKFQKNSALLLKEDNTLLESNKIFGTLLDKFLPGYFKKLIVKK